VRQLHVVALSEDGRSVLLATSKNAKTGGFSVPLDARLAAALRGDLPRPGEQRARDVSVTPKEIQARLRAGESPQQIADSAGVPVARVDRFAGPVLSERERIIDEARAAFLSRNRRGLSLLPLGDAVDAALAETASLRPESVAWSARRLESGHWLVQVSYVARARTRTASWVYEPQTRSVTASDAPSAALGHVGEEATPRRVAVPAVRRTPAAAKPARKRPARKTARKKAAAKTATPAARKPAAAQAAPATAIPKSNKKAAPVTAAPAKAGRKAPAKAAKKAAAKAAAATPAPAARKAAPPAAKAVAKKAAPAAAPAAKPAAAKKPAAKMPAAKKAAAKKQPRSASSRTLRRSAAAEELASTPVVRWGPAVDQPGPPTLRVVPTPQPEPLFEAAPQPLPDIVAEAAREVAPAAAPEPAAASPAPKRRAAGERAHVPDWADVLLGATPKRTDD
jgi:hypothetical protein